MAFCKNCGTQVNDGARFCPRCGSMIHPPSAGGHFPSANSFFHSPDMDDGESSPDYGYPYPGDRYPDHGRPGPGGGESYFDGDGFELLGYRILLTLVSIVTCGIAAPWMLVKIYQWRISHTVIDGKRQCFNGTGGQLFGSWIKWWLLTLVTCGLYGFYLPVALQKWETSHTSYEDSPEAHSAVYENSWFEGTFAGFIGNYILCVLLTLVTCGIAYPWGATMLIRWTTEGERVDGFHYCYNGTGGGLFGEYIIGFLLSLVTCGIYSSWATCRVNRYVISHTHIARRIY